MLLCEQCITAIKSRGEKVWVGPTVERDEDLDNKGNWVICDDLKCEWCGEKDTDLYDCRF